MFSKILRRTHMYLALFLTPWVLMYTASTFVMNHRDWFQAIYGKSAPSWIKESETVFGGSVAQDEQPKDTAPKILASLGIQGTHTVTRPDTGGTFSIVRQFATNEKRITFTPASKALLIEHREFRPNVFLERFHRRRGYQTENAVDDTWAFSVDFVVAAIVFWALSGLWLWWELKVTRRLGAAFFLGGIVLFAIFLRTT
jgi:hypothetical protein